MYVELPKKTKKNVNVWLNMNRFMNLHHIMKNNAKKVFFEVMRDQLEGIKIDTPVNITYQLFNRMTLLRQRQYYLQNTTKVMVE